MRNTFSKDQLISQIAQGCGGYQQVHIHDSVMLLPLSVCTPDEIEDIAPGMQGYNIEFTDKVRLAHRQDHFLSEPLGIPSYKEIMLMGVMRFNAPEIDLPAAIAADIEKLQDAIRADQFPSLPDKVHALTHQKRLNNLQEIVTLGKPATPSDDLKAEIGVDEFYRDDGRLKPGIKYRRLTRIFPR